MKVIVPAPIFFVFLMTGRCWKIEDVVVTDGIQDYLLCDVQRGKSGIVYSHGLALVVLLFLAVRFRRSCIYGLLGVRGEVVVSSLSLVVPSLFSTLFVAFVHWFCSLGPCHGSISTKVPTHAYHLSLSPSGILHGSLSSNFLL